MPSVIRGSDNFDSAGPFGLAVTAESIIGDDGYIHFANGLILQWGTHPTDGTVTLPLAYPTEQFLVVATINSSSGSAISDEEIRVHTLTTTQFTYLVINTNRTIFWISIGK